MVAGMVERAARALCLRKGLDPDHLLQDEGGPYETWRSYVPDVVTVLSATVLPPVEPMQDEEETMVSIGGGADMELTLIMPP